LPCDVPAELGRLHYHNLSEESGYIMNLAGLINDLQQLKSPNQETSAPTPTPKTSAGNRNISIGGDANNSQIVIGDGNTVSQSND